MYCSVIDRGAATGAQGNREQKRASQRESHLYVVGQTPACLVAFAGLNRLCDEHSEWLTAQDN